MCQKKSKTQLDTKLSAGGRHCGTGRRHGRVVRVLNPLPLMSVSTEQGRSQTEFFISLQQRKKSKSQQAQGAYGLLGIWVLNTVTHPNSKGLCHATEKENTKINHVCVYKTSCLCGLFFISLSHSSSYSWPKGVSMPALLHGMSKKGKKK